MIKAILNGILSMISTCLNIILLPVNALFNTLFPDMTTSINNFSSFINNYVGGSLSFFFSVLPPITRNIIIVWLTFVVSYYTIYYTYEGFCKIWAIVQKIKFW